MKPRLLFIPLDWWLPHRPHKELREQLDMHFDVTYMEEHSLLNKYDYIFMQSGAISHTSIFGRKEKIIQWTGDARAETMENVTQYAGIADLTLLAVGIGQKEMYSKVMGKVDYLQQGVFNSFFIEPKELQSGYVVFIGNNYDHFEGAIERSELCREVCVEGEWPAEIIGNGWDHPFYINHRSIPYTESAKIYNESYISISHACFNDIEGYYSNRTIDIMASGGCCLQRWFPGIEKYFTDGYDCVVYRTNDEAIEKIRYLIERPELRNLIARNGHNTAKLKHTFDVRARELKQLIEKHL